MQSYASRNHLLEVCSLAMHGYCARMIYDSPRFDTPPSAQQEENYLPRCRNHLPSSGRKNTLRKHNVCIVKKVQKKEDQTRQHYCIITLLEVKYVGQREGRIRDFSLYISFFWFFVE
jgi:hypothetical protein